VKVATIRQRGNRVEVQIRRKGWTTVSETFPDKTSAREWATVIEADMVRGVFMDRSEAERNTLGDLFDRYLRDVSASKKGASSESYRLRALQRDPISQYKVAALSGKVLAEWRDRRMKQVTGSTTNRDQGLISHVINVARKEWGINVENPVSMIRRPPESRGRNRRLSASEEQRLLSELEPSTRCAKGYYEEDLRHEGASRMAEKLDNVLELSAVTGHKTLSMLKRYYHPRAKDLARKLG
jgi:integrase